MIIGWVYTTDLGGWWGKMSEDDEEYFDVDMIDNWGEGTTCWGSEWEQGIGDTTDAYDAVDDWLEVQTGAKWGFETNISSVCNF